MPLQHLRSSTANKRPTPASMSDGQLAVNTNLDSPGLFFKDSNGALVKVGPVHVGTTAPNVSPAVGGQSGNSVGEQWLDTSGTNPVLKIWNGTAWASEAGEFVNASGDTMTGALVMANQQQVRFREQTGNGTNHIALQAPAAVASDKVITLPDVTGTVVTTGDTGSVTSAMIADGAIVNGDINASAAIADTKLATIATADKVSLSAINIDGGTDIGAALADADLFIVDDGGAGTNRKAAATRITDYTFSKVSGDVTVTSAGVSTIKASVALTGTPTAPTAAAGTNTTQIATTAFVTAATDAARQGLSVKQSCRVATTANITLSGTQTIDAVAVVAGDRVLVKDQSTGSQNGIYVVAAGAWARATDFDADADITDGAFTFVEEGTANADSGWVLTTNGPIVVGTTALVFAQFSGAGQITAGNGLTRTGNTVDVVGTAGRIVANADSIDLATAGTAGTYRSVTTDAYGRVTAGTNPTTLAGYGITDAATSTHVHGSVTNDGRIGSTAHLPVVTTTGGSLSTISAGSANQVLISNGGASAPSWATLDLSYLPGSAFKKSVRVATTAGLTATFATNTLTNSGALAALTIDGVALAVNDRVLVKNQSSAAQNGIYRVTNIGSISVAWTMTRDADADTSAEISAAVVAIDEGTANAGELWTTTFKATDTLNTTAMPWYEVVYNNGTWAISITGNAATASAWATGRTITLTGDISGSSGAWTGSGDIFFSTSIAAGAVVNASISASAAIADTKLATISTAGKVANSATTATNLNTASAIVARDASGNFTAGTITAALSGNASTASAWATGRTITLTGDVTGVSGAWTGSGNISFATAIAAGSIVDADVNAAAAIAGTKISPNFGSQAVSTTGTITGASLIPSSATVPTNGLFLPAANTVGIATGSTERLRVTSTGTILAGSTSAIGDAFSPSGVRLLTLVGSSASIGVHRNDATAFSNAFIFTKARGTALETVQSGDTLGMLTFQGANGTAFAQAATIEAYADGTPSSTSMPGRLVFYTTPSGSTTPVERLRVRSDGDVVVAGNLQTATINSGPLAGFRNAIINGNFDIWQRGTSFSSPANNAYVADRWAVVWNGTGATRTISRVAFTVGQTDVPGEPTYFLRWNQSVAGSNATFTGIQQRIESVRTFAGRQVRVSFYAKAASALTLPSIGFKQAFGTGGTPSPDVTTLLASSVSITTSWQKFSYAVTVPSITAQTLGTDGNDSLILDLGLPLNAAYTFDLSQVQVELGPIATPFERRPIGAELALCQRYYCTTTASVRGYVAATAQGVGASFYWPVEMRNTPTLTDSGGSLTNVSAVTVDLADKNSAMMRVSATTAPGYVYVAGRTITASAEI